MSRISKSFRDKAASEFRESRKKLGSVNPAKSRERARLTRNLPPMRNGYKAIRYGLRSDRQNGAKFRSERAPSPQLELHHRQLPLARRRWLRDPTVLPPVTA